MSTHPIGGMSCEGCVRALERALAAAGIPAEVRLGSVTLSRAQDAARLARVVAEAGFTLQAPPPPA